MGMDQKFDKMDRQRGAMTMFERAMQQRGPHSSRMDGEDAGMHREGAKADRSGEGMTMFERAMQCRFWSSSRMHGKRAGMHREGARADRSGEAMTKSERSKEDRSSNSSRMDGKHTEMDGVGVVTKEDRPGYTVALVEKALQRYDTMGREATVAYYNTPESVDGEWYVFIMDEDGILIAHVDPERLGEDIKGDLGLDATGYRFGDLVLSATEEGLWVDYLFLNAATGAEQTKHSWVVRHDGLIIGSGWYE